MDQAEKLIEIIGEHYKTSTIKLYLLASGWKKVYRIAQANSPDWIVRAYPPPREDNLRVDVEAQVSVLLFLEEQTYPAERVVRAASGASLIREDGWQIFITTFVGQSLAAWQPADQVNATQPVPTIAKHQVNPPILFGLGAALGRLHALLPTRTLPQAGMLPSRELTWAATNLARMGTQVPEPFQAQYQHLLTMIQNADRYEDLPFVLIHNDCNISNAVITPAEQIALIDWESAGRGPAMIDIGILLSNCFSKQQRCIDHAAITAIVDGYCQHRLVSAVELARLPDAIRFFRLVLLASYFPERANQTLPDHELIYGATYAQWQAQYEASAEIAALARQRFESYL